MSFHAYLTAFHGLPVHPLSKASDPADGEADALPAPGAVAWKLDCFEEGEVPFDDVWDDFLARVPSSGVRALVLGAWWHDSYTPLGPALARITADASRFPALRALFLGDVVSEECEVSWLELADVTTALTSFPQLEELVVRGGQGLALTPLRHGSLRALRFQSGGLPAEVVRAVGSCDLPALADLELWLGVEDYGGDTTVADLGPVLSGGRFPALRRLGLQDSELQDEIAAAVASAPVVAQLEELSLALGTLTDTGAEALLHGQPLSHLRRLDLHHHFVGEETAARLAAAVSVDGTEVDLSEHQAPEVYEDREWRYVAVSE